MATNAELIAQIRATFDEMVAGQREITALANRLKDGTASFKDIDRYSTLVGRLYSKAIMRHMGAFDIAQFRTLLQEVVPSSFRELHTMSGDYARGVIDHMLADAGTGMRAVEIEYDTVKEENVLKAIQESADTAEEPKQVEPEMTKQIESLSQKSATDTVRKNAEFDDDAGLDVRVTRIYDGIGVHDRTEPCQWCIEKCCNNVPYAEAKNLRAFNRHPGCHCEILYTAKKRTTRQTSAGSWSDASTLQARRDYGMNQTTVTPEERIAQAEALLRR